MPVHSRFLCPHCLQFGEALYACPGCWEDTGVLRLRLNVGDLQACPCCYDALYSEVARDHLAYCEHCKQVSDAQRHHDREVRILGTMGPASFAWMCRLFGQVPAEGGPVRLVRAESVIYLLDVSMVARDFNAIGTTHALRHLECLFLAGAELEALELGRMLDRFIRQARSSGGQRRALQVMIREASLPANAVNVIRSRLPNIRYGMDQSSEFLVGPDWSAENLDLHSEGARIVATIDKRDFHALTARLPTDQLRCLHPGITCVESRGRLTIVVDAGQLSRSRRERVAPVQQAAEAIWIESLPAAEQLPQFVERLGLRFGLSLAARNRIDILIGQNKVDEEQCALLTESFPNVRWGVTPAEALAGASRPPADLADS